MYLVGRHAPRSGGPPQWRIGVPELERFEAAYLSKKARPGYDLTLRPPKSVSVLWALGPEPLRRVTARPIVRRSTLWWATSRRTLSTPADGAG